MKSIEHGIFQGPLNATYTYIIPHLACPRGPCFKCKVGLGALSDPEAQRQD